MYTVLLVIYYAHTFPLKPSYVTHQTHIITYYSSTCYALKPALKTRMYKLLTIILGYRHNTTYTDYYYYMTRHEYTRTNTVSFVRMVWVYRRSITIHRKGVVNSRAHIHHAWRILCIYYDVGLYNQHCGLTTCINSTIYIYIYIMNVLSWCCMHIYITM